MVSLLTQDVYILSLSLVPYLTPSNTREVLRYYILPALLSAATDITIDGDTFSEGRQRSSPGSSAAALLLDSPPNSRAKVYSPFFFFLRGTNNKLREKWKYPGKSYLILPKLSIVTILPHLFFQR